MNRVENQKAKTLSIRISTDGFCFCCYVATEPDSLQYHRYETDKNITMAANFENAWNSCPFTSGMQYNDIKVIIATEKFTAIPTVFDNQQENKQTYMHCFPQTMEDTEIAANRLTAQEATILFPVEGAIYNRLKETGQVTYYTTASILLGYITRKPLDAERYILAYYTNGKSLCISINNGKMLLSNCFTSDDPHDQIFYLLSIWKEQGLSQTNDKLYLCGDKTVEELTPLIEQFIRRHERINPNKEFRSNLLNKIKEIPFDLQALILCE